MEKTCKKCEETKSVNLFRKNRNYFENSCIKCIYIWEKIKRKENKEVIAEKAKARYYLAKETNIELFKHKKHLSDKKYREDNREIVSLRKKKYKIDNPEIIRKQSKKDTENLRPYYVRAKLMAKGIPKNEITTELIDLQTIIIKTKRLCKTSQI